MTGLAALYLEANPTAAPAAVLSALQGNAANLGNIDGDGDVDYLVRSPVATPACNVPQRLFTNEGTATIAATAVKYMPSGTYTGPDAFNYTITPSTHGTGTVKVIVQPPVN